MKPSVRRRILIASSISLSLLGGVERQVNAGVSVSAKLVAIHSESNGFPFPPSHAFLLELLASLNAAITSAKALVVLETSILLER